MVPPVCHEGTGYGHVTSKVAGWMCLFLAERVSAAGVGQYVHGILGLTPLLSLYAAATLS